jgi:phage tail protein X
MPRTYNTIQGDTWDWIAKKHYGDEFAIPPLLDANPEYMDVVIFPSGVALVIPELPEGYDADKTMPPWRSS